MEINFTEENEWILPIEGIRGNKSSNLRSNTDAIKKVDLMVPRSLVIPHEYLRAVENPGNFTLDQIEKYFSNWIRMFVRSDSPDEDMNSRFPGQYVSEHLWHEDRDYWEGFIDNVLESYNKPSAKMRRKQSGLGELGMGLLIQVPVSNTLGEFDASYSGAFSDIGELALLNFTDPTKGLDAMQTSPLKKYWVDVKGVIQEEHTEKEANIAQRLRSLTESLPYIEGKGWEIEFVRNQDGTYVVQTTPVVKRERVVIPEDVENIFDSIAVVGTGEVITDGILYVPPTADLDELLRFDLNNSNYCLVTIHNNIALGNKINILEYLTNATAIIDVGRHWPGRPYAPHVEQHMREGRVALAGTFNNEFRHMLVNDHTYFRLSNEDARGVIYSPTRLIVKTDEISQKGTVALADGKVYDFVPISPQF